MAKNDVKKVSRIKEKKKLWYKIIAPKVFAQKEIGETYMASAESGIGRKLKANLRDLNGNIKDQNVYIGFKIEKADGNNLHTSLVSYEIIPTHIKRIVRKNINRMDDHFIFKTKDGREVILNSLMITLNKTSRSTRAVMRRQLKELFTEEIKQGSLDQFVNNLVSYKVQSAFKKKLSKIYPLKEIAIRVLKLKSEANEAEIQEVKTEETETAKEVKKEEMEVPEMTA